MKMLAPLIAPMILLCLTASVAADTAPKAALAVNLPTNWEAADIGPVRKSGSVRYDAAAKSFTVRSIGEATENRGTFGYTRVKGDFVATCRVTAASAKSVGAGLMVRTGSEFGARFLKNAFNGVRFGNGPAVTIRQTDNVAAWQPGDIAHVQPLPCWVRVIRYHDSLASYYSADGQEWNLMHFGGARFSPGLPDEVLVGVVNSQHDSDELEEATMDSYAGDAEGGYLFIGGLSEKGVKKISIWAIDPRTGEMAQRFLPGPEVAGYGGWFDFNNAINAMKRKDGEYILFADDDGAQKVNMFRWKP